MYAQLNQEIARQRYAELLRERPEHQMVKEVVEKPEPTRRARVRRRLAFPRLALRLI